MSRPAVFFKLIGRNRKSDGARVSTRCIAQWVMERAHYPMLPCLCLPAAAEEV